jgi:hypothetical protein
LRYAMAQGRVFRRVKEQSPSWLHKGKSCEPEGLQDLASRP